LQKSAKKILQSAGSVDSGTARAILRIPASSSDQKSLCPPITSGLNIYFTQSIKKPRPIKGLEGMYSLKRLSEVV
jgi:hypothetical protein